MEPQWQTALTMGNEKRAARKKLKEAVKEGRKPVWKVILENPPCLITTSHTNHPITLIDIMTWPRRAQRPTQLGILRRCRMDPYTELHHLSESRRKMLARHLH